jgi:hypothetical protein
LICTNGFQTPGNLKLKEEAFIYPCAKGFFIVEFDLVEDRDLILNSDPSSGEILDYV